MHGSLQGAEACMGLTAQIPENGLELSCVYDIVHKYFNVVVI